MRRYPVTTRRPFPEMPSAPPPASHSGSPDADDQPAFGAASGRRPDESAAQRLRRRRRQRLGFVAGIAASYAVDTSLMAALVAAGGLGLEVPAAYGMAGALLCAAFAAVFASQWPERQRDHYLVRTQLAAHVALNLACVALAPQVGWLMLMILFVIFGFAALRMGTRPAVLASTLTAVTVGAMLFAIGDRISVPMDTPAQRLVSGMWLSLVLMRMTALGLYGSRFRDLLAERNLQLASTFQRLEHLASRDELTGALNRRCVMQVLEEERERMRRTGQRFGIALFDLDHFKQVNDGFGHVVGDEVLRRFVLTVAGEMRATDRLGRYGGEEFLMIVPGTAMIDHAAAAAERVRACVARQPWEDVHEGLTVTVSAGVTLCNDDDTSERLLARADQALYAAKREGRNRVLAADRPVAPEGKRPPPSVPLTDTIADAGVN